MQQTTSNIFVIYYIWFRHTSPQRAKYSETNNSLQRYSKSAAYQNKLLKIQINIVST